MMAGRALLASVAPVALAALAFSVAGCDGRPRPESSAGEREREPPKKQRGPSVAVMDLSGGVPEQDKGGLFGVSSGHRSFDELLHVIAELREEDDETRAVMVKLGSASIGAARAEEIGDALADLKSKRPVQCQAETLSNATLMLAARGCSAIWLAPAGGVDAIGIAAQVIYMRRLLADELHLSIDMLQVGKFKGAEEPLTRDGPSPEARASLTSVLADMRAAWLDTLGTARVRATADVVEDGPWTPGRAKELGLVDEIGFYDEALKTARAASGAVRDRVVFGPGAEDDDAPLEDVVRALAGEGSDEGPIALVRATGSISMSGGGGLLGGRGGIIEKDFDKTIAKLERSDDVKAVVVRIDSPGGSALASDLMWHQLVKLRKKKPLVFSVGDMAASGGYYLASSGDYIFAEPMSIVGSIGVVGGKVAVGDALERIGVHAETFPANAQKPGAAARSAYESPLLAWDEPTKARVLESMTGVYDLFLSRVAEGRSASSRAQRKVPKEKVAESAEGRIFSGRQGKERGLVDEIGGLEAAIAKARALAKLSPHARVAVAGGKGGFFDGLDPGGGEESARARIEAKAAKAAKAATPLEVLEKTAPELVPFATSMAPLLEGERTAAALPFALTVR
jgi:protease-4